MGRADIPLNFIAKMAADVNSVRGAAADSTNRRAKWEMRSLFLPTSRVHSPNHDHENSGANAKGRRSPVQ